MDVALGVDLRRLATAVKWLLGVKLFGDALERGDQEVAGIAVRLELLLLRRR